MLNYCCFIYHTAMQAEILTLQTAFFFLSPSNRPDSSEKDKQHQLEKCNNEKVKVKEPSFQTFKQTKWLSSFIFFFCSILVYTEHTYCRHLYIFLLQNASEDISKSSEKPPLGPSATLPANMEEDSFGSRKARSSFGKGFFKIRGGKKTTSSPNLGKRKLPWNASASLGPCSILLGLEASSGNGWCLPRSVIFVECFSTIHHILLSQDTPREYQPRP